MRLIKKVSLLLLSFMSINAYADCQHFEFSELQQMKTNKLESEYCATNFEIQMLQIRRKAAHDQNDVQYARASGAGKADVAKNLQVSDKASASIENCFNERRRINDLLLKRKVKIEKLEKLCPISE